MFESLELVFVMAAVGVPFYLYISITHYFQQKMERRAYAVKLAVADQVSSIAALEGEIENLRDRLREMENTGTEKTPGSIDALRNAKAA